MIDLDIVLSFSFDFLIDTRFKEGFGELALPKDWTVASLGLVGRILS